MLALTFALLAAVVIGTNGCTNICKKFTNDDVPGCHLNGNGCECIAILKKPTYKVSLTDSTTGTTGNSDYRSSEAQAGNYAVFNLFAMDQGCNCHFNASIPLGPCSYNGKVCFKFASVADVASKNPSFNLSVNVVSPVSSPVYWAIAPNATAQGFEAAGEILAGQIFLHYPQCIPHGGSMAAALANTANLKW